MMTDLDVDTGPKGVTSFTLLRLGLTWGDRAASCSNPRYGYNWGLLGNRDIENLLSELVRKMKSQPYGTGDMLMMLLGEEKGREVAKNEGVSVRGLVVRKRTHGPAGESSEDEEPKAKARKR